MARVAALLRGINVGGTRRVPMARLREVVEGLGHDDVATYLNSGNVVFTPAKRVTGATLERQLEEALEDAFGFEIPVMVRTAAELRRIVDDRPFPDATDPKLVHVVFLGGTLTAKDVEAVAPADHAPDEWVLRGRELYLHTPKGFGTSKLAAKLAGGRLNVPSTARNWRTVLALLQMA